MLVRKSSRILCLAVVTFLAYCCLWYSVWHGLFTSQKINDASDDVTALLETYSHNLTHQSVIHRNTSQRDMIGGKYGNVKILCFVLTSPKTIDIRGQVVLSTWGKRCDKFLFVNDEPHPSYPTMDLYLKQGYSSLYNKTSSAMFYLYKHHPQYDWYLKTDDDTYVIVENLRRFLSNYSPGDALLFGDPLRQKFGNYFSGGGGYAFSRESMRRFAESKSLTCTTSDKSVPEDAMMGLCMKRLGVTLGVKQSCDARGRARFHALPLDVFLNSNKLIPGWYQNMSLCYTGYGIENLSDETISFHYMSTTEMKALEFLLYKVSPRIYSLIK